MKLCAMTHAHEAGTTGRQGRRCGDQSIVTFNGDIASSEGRREKTTVPACGRRYFYNRFLVFTQHFCDTPLRIEGPSTTQRRHSNMSKTVIQIDHIDVATSADLSAPAASLRTSKEATTMRRALIANAHGLFMKGTQQARHLIF